MNKTAAVVLTLLAGCGELSDQSLRHWKRASDYARERVFPDERIRDCVTRLSMLPDTESVKVTDAGEICMTGLGIKERNAKTKK